MTGNGMLLIREVDVGPSKVKDAGGMGAGGRWGWGDAKKLVSADVA